MPAVALCQTAQAPNGRPRWSARWLDCPVALHFAGLGAPVIAANLPIVDGASPGSEWREVILARRADVPALLEIFEKAFLRRPIMTVIGGASAAVAPLDWQDLVLEDSVVRLVKDDFLLFLDRQQWYRTHRMPFRRGYLLHGPPGNGKSSVVRAMLSTPGLSGFTVNPFRGNLDRDMLAVLFAEAAEAIPAIVVLEDLDRWFPVDKPKDPESQLPLQQLLNHLDGVASQDGIIVVATANHAALLDPAILRRPGRFDRVVGFANPSQDLRCRYLRQVLPGLDSAALTACAQATAGFSFAQLREVYILAGQFALDEQGALDEPGAFDPQRLIRAAHVLKETMASSDPRWELKTGFR